MTDAAPHAPELAIIAWLASPEGRAVVDSLRGYDASAALATAERLRRADIAPEHAAAALTQARVREAARPRLGPVVDELVVTPDGAEQATRTVVADLHAQRLRAAGVTAVADLGCGMGSDSLAFVRAGLDVTAVERDPVTAATARVNLEHAARAAGTPDAVRVIVGDALAHAATLPADTALWADPARRRDGRRLRDPEQWSPPLSAVLELATHDRALGVKVAPGIDHAAVPHEAELEFVSVDGDLVEAALWWGSLRERPGRTATVVRTRGTASGAGGPTVHTLREDAVAHPQALNATSPVRMAPVRDLGAYLFEPDDAVLRAGLVAAAGERLGPAANAGIVSPGIAYLTADELPDAHTPEHVAEEPHDLPAERPGEPQHPAAAFLTAYRVLDDLPLTVKILRPHLRSLGVTAVTIKKRGVSVEPEALRRELGLGGKAASRRPTTMGPREATIVVTPIQGRTRVLLVEPVPWGRMDR